MESGNKISLVSDTLWEKGYVNPTEFKSSVIKTFCSDTSPDDTEPEELFGAGSPAEEDFDSGFRQQYEEEDREDFIFRF